MLKKKSILYLFILCISLIFMACSSKSDNTNEKPENNNTSETSSNNEENEDKSSGGELQIAFAQQPPILDTHVTQGQAAADIAKQVFETLVVADTSGNIQPMLADSWEENEDGTQITFNLRQGVQFHNGKELKSEDVVASMNRWIEISGAGKEQFPEATFKVIDDYTTVLELAQPTSTALAILAYTGGGFASIMPKEIIEEAEATGVKEYVGTGPFQFHEWKQDQYLHLKKFLDYNPRTEPSDGVSGSKEALLDDIYFNFIADTSTRVAGVISGDYDISESIPRDSVEQIENDPDLEIQVYDGGFLSYFFNKRRGIFSDITAREAVLAALDMDEILQASYSHPDFYNLNHNMMLTSQSAIWYSDEGEDKYNQKDLEKAKELLSQTNYNGEEITILTTREHEQSYNAAIVLQKTLEEMGMEVAIAVVDRPTFEDLRETEDAFDIFVLQNTPKPEPSSNVYLRSNFGGWTESPELDEIIEDFRGKPSLEDAKMVYNDLQKWFYSYIPIIKVGDYSGVMALRKDVKNLQNFEGYILWNVSNEKE